MASRPELTSLVPRNSSSGPHEAINILLSTDRKDLSEVIATTNLEQVNKDKGTILLTSNNTSFLSLEHRLQDTQEGLRVVLTIADPGADVINALLGSNISFQQKFEKEIGEKSKEVRTDREYAKYYIAYGIGSDFTSWAGPFIMHLFNVNYFYDSAGLETLEMSFTAQISMVSQIKLKSPSDSDFGITNAKVSSSTKSLIGQARYEFLPPLTYSRLINTTVNSLSVLLGIERCHDEWAKVFGIDNFIIIYPAKVMEDLVSFGSALFGGTTRTVFNRNGIFLYKKSLSDYGLTITIEPALPTSGTTTPLSSASTTNYEDFDVFIDIDQNTKQLIGEDSNSEVFTKPFDKFWEAATRVIGEPLSYDVYQESNTDILALLKKYSPATYGSKIVKDDAPLTIIAEESCLHKEIYGGGVELTFVPLDSTEARYKEAIVTYLLNKHNHTNIFLSKAPDSIEKPDGFGLTLSEVREQATKGVPVFEANTRNSNILSFEFDYSNIMLAAFNKDLGKVPAGQEDSVKASIIANLKTLVSNGEGFTSLKDVGREFNYDQVAEDIMNTVFSSDETRISFKSGGPDSLKDSIAPYIKFFWEHAILRGIKGVIKTLPQFNLSDNSVVGKLCIINIFKNPDPYANTRDNEVYNTIYSGVYKIMSYKHSISGSSASSEFGVVKMSYPLKSNKGLRTFNSYGMTGAEAV